MGLRIQVLDLGFRVQGLGFGVWGLGFRVQGLGFGVYKGQLICSVTRTVQGIPISK